MKILIVTLEYPPELGGIASYVLNLAGSLPAENVVVYAPQTVGGAAFDSHNQWKIYRRKPYSWLLWPRWLRLLWQLWRIIKKEKISVMYVHHVLPVGYVAYILKKICRVPYVLFFHGTDLGLAARTTFKKRRLHQICRGADRIMVNSDFLKGKLLNYFEELTTISVLHPCPGDFFFNPAPLEQIKKIKSQLALAGKKVIITVSRMVEGKGYPHLIRVLPDILKQIPNVVWLIIGDGPKRQEIFTAIQKNYLQNVVRFLGNIPYHELPLYYQAADLFVLLTHPDENTEEGWGTVFLEAAASGLPVIAGRAGGVEEAVENLNTGIVIDVHQSKAVVGAIVGLLKDPAYSKQMGKTAKERAMQEFRWEKQIKKLRAI